MHVVADVHKPTYSRKHYPIKKQRPEDPNISLRLHTPASCKPVQWCQEASSCSFNLHFLVTKNAKHLVR